MILTTVKTTKIIEQNNSIVIPPQGIEIYHFTDIIFYKNDLKNIEDAQEEKTYSLLPIFLDLFNFRVLKRIVVTNKISVNDKEDKDAKDEDDETKSPSVDVYSKIVSSKVISLEIYKQLIKLRNEKKLRGVGLISTVTQNSTRNSTLFDLSSVMFKLSQRYPSLNNKTSDFLDNISKMTKTKIAKKVLIITTTTSCNKQNSFIRSLYRELNAKRTSHNINNYDYVIISLYHSKTLEHIETRIINTEKIIYLLRNIAIVLSNSIAHEKLSQKEIEGVIENVHENIAKKLSTTEDDSALQNIKDSVTKAVKRNLYLLPSLETSADLNNFTKYVVKNIVSETEEEQLESTSEENVYQSMDSEISENDKDLLSITSQTEKNISINKLSNISEHEIKEEIKKLLNIKFENVSVPSTFTHKKSLSSILPIKKISNVHTMHMNSMDIVKNTIELYNKTYWKKIGYNVEIEDVEIVNKGRTGSPSFVNEVTLNIKYGKKVKRSKVIIPNFDDNGIAWINGTPRALVNQLFTLPIVNIGQGKILFKSMYSSITVSLLTKNKITYYESYLLSKKYPIILLMLCLKDIDTIFNDLEIKSYKIVSVSNINEYKNEYIKIKISNDAYIVINTSKIHKHQLFFINTIKVFVKLYDTANFTYFNNPDFWDQITLNIVQPKIYHLLKSIDSIFVDPFTKTILEYYSLPTKMYEILLYMIYATMDANITEENDISMKRLRNHEIISVLLYKNINSSLLAHATKIKDSIVIPKECIVNDLLVGEASTMFQMIQQDYNPLFYCTAKTRVTYKGLDGIMNVNNNMRNLHPSMMCLIDPVDTSENASVGETQHLTLDATVTNIFGKLDNKSCHGIGITTSLIPFYRSNDGNRVQMSDTQLKQTLPLVYAERPFVSTGFEPTISLLTSKIFVVRSDVEGEVIEANEKTIIIQDKNKKKHVYILGDQYTTQTKINQVPIVSIGDKVLQGQIIAENKNFFDNGFYKYGLNARVVYMNYLGYGIEDGLIISESFSRKLSSLKSISYSTTSIEIPTETKVVYIRSDKGEVKKGDDLVILKVKKDLYKNVFGFNFQAVITYEDDFVFVKLKAQKTGTIEDIEVYKGKNGLHESLKSLYSEFNKNYVIEKQDSKTEYHYATERERYLFTKKEEEQSRNSIVIYRISYVDHAIIGDKLTNRHASKGIISLVLPDEKMPRDDEGPFDMIYNPYSILGRKNIGQLVELRLGECIRKINIMMKQLYESNKVNEINTLINDTINSLVSNKEYKEHLLSFFNGKNNKDLIEDIIKHGFSLPVGLDNNITLQNINKLMKHLNIKPLKKVYVPELGTYTKQECNYGTLYISKLQQKVETKYRQRSIGLYDSKTGQATQGKKVEGGSKFGEYDCYSLISHNSENIIKEIYTVMSDDHESKYKLINSIVEKGSCKLKDLNIKSTSSSLAMLYLVGLHSLEL